MPAPSLPLKRKLEVALLSYLQQATPLASQGWGFHHGAYAGARKLPRLVVHVENAEPAFEGALPKWCTATIYLLSNIDASTSGNEASEEGQDARRDEAEATHDAAQELVDAALNDVDAIQAHVNKVNTENRPVTDFYLYDVVEAGEGTDIESRQFGNGLRRRILCEKQDN